jgi:alpha-mannosidase
MATPSPKPILYIVINNHFDLTWRRCWQRPFEYKGQTYISYLDIETYYMLDNLALAEQNASYKFEAESVQVVRKFLERCPERLADLQRLQREGRFAITGGGEAIVDANMIHGESLVRNYVDGLLWVEENFGQKTRLAVRNDAFGNSAQLPQILRGCEIAWATGMSYSPAGGIYWRGLDGSTILHRSLPEVATGGGIAKYIPCIDCRGTGGSEASICPTCGGRGIDPNLHAALPGEIDQQALAQFGAGLVKMTPEELLPNPGLLAWAEQMGTAYDVRFALQEDVLPHLQPWLEALDQPDADCLHQSLELNPNNSGVLVSRIKTKQVVRRQEQAVLAAENLSVMSALIGKPYPKDVFKCIRQQQYFTMFHDAITATHIDPAYQELVEIWQGIESDTTAVQNSALSSLVTAAQPGEFAVINPTVNTVTGICTARIHAANNAIEIRDENGLAAPVVAVRGISSGQYEIDFVAHRIAPLSSRQYRVSQGNEDPNSVQPLAEAVIENEYYRISADENGLVEIFDKRLGQAAAVSGGYRPGELILEHDEGSPWATLHPDQTRTPLSPYTRLETAEKGAAFQQLVFHVLTPWKMGFSSRCLRAKITVRLVQGLEQVDFQVNAAWDAFNHRLRMAMPVPRGEQSCRHLYEIPYGVIEREPYQPAFDWAAANGDWPAIHWAGVEQPGLSVALLNQGTPSYRIETSQDGDTEIILLSLLRSPAIPTYLHEPYFYSMLDYDGMRDAGDHCFTYALKSYNLPLNESSIVPDAEGYNASLIAVEGRAALPEMPVVQSPVARAAAVKWAEDSSGLVLRLVEFRGQGGPVRVDLPPAFTAAARVNLLERQAQPLALDNQSVQLVLRPWEIATLKLT